MHGVSGLSGVERRGGGRRGEEVSRRRPSNNKNPILRIWGIISDLSWTLQASGCERQGVQTPRNHSKMTPQPPKNYTKSNKNNNTTIQKIVGIPCHICDFGVGAGGRRRSPCINIENGYIFFQCVIYSPISSPLE